MLNALFPLARPLLYAMSPEDAHETTLKLLEAGLYPRARIQDPAELSSNFAAIALPNPIGIAAGFDKDARVPDAVLGMGCGFAEVGTVTPLPQPGNPKPRSFRLVPDHAVINRLGFNNNGHAAALSRLKARRNAGVVGVNIGANKDAIDRTADYVAGINTFYDVASYFTVNISSPNTPGLRDLQAPAALGNLLEKVMAARTEKAAAYGRQVPVFVKIAPDIAMEDLPAITDRIMSHGVDGIAVSNTTLTRPHLIDPQSREQGGLSGRPLFHRSTVMLAKVYKQTGGAIPLIGIGGIDSGARALAKIEAGATLVQLYTGLIFEGPGLIEDIKSELVSATRRAGVKSIGELTGTKAGEWAEKPLEP